MQGVERTLIRRIFDAVPSGALNLGLGQPDLATPPRLALAGIDGIARGRTAYTSTAGDPALRAAIAARYGRTPESVVVTVGSQEAVFAAVLTLADPEDEVLYPDPGYPAYPVVAHLVGARPIAYPLRPERGFRVDPDDVASRITSRTRLVLFCSPSNPTGAVDSREDLERVAGVLRERGVAWLSDEIYGGFAYEGPAPSLREIDPEGGVVVSGLSKELSMTGWRIGWALAPADVAAKIAVAHQYLVTCAPSVSQAAALAAFGPDGDAERAAYLEVFRRRRALMAAELAKIPGIRFALPQGAFYFFVDVSSHGSSLDIARRVLERKKVILVPGEAFGVNAAGWLRISYAADDDAIVRGIRALGDELAGQ